MRLAVMVLLAPAVGTATRSSAQSAPVISGRVVNTATDAPVPDALVSRLGQRSGGAATDRHGRFAIQVEALPVRLLVVRLGFAPDTVTVLSTASVEVRLVPSALRLDELVAIGRVPGRAAERVAGEVDIAIRPRESAQDLLRLAPGVVIAQHAGGGKAEQIFVRGFDADHGTDVAVSVDGTPVNLVSHAHGQGYADLHFVIPGTVERVEVRKGALDVRDGNLATAAAVALVTRDRLPGGSVELRAGSFGAADLTTLIPFGAGREASGGYLALSGLRADGPFDAPQGYRRGNGFARWTAPVGARRELVATMSAFGARWDASGQIPERAVASGLIGRFGAIDATEGGKTHRFDAAVALRSTSGDADWEVRAFATRYRLQLFSNFTFFANDSEAGDGIEQVDDRYLGGFTAHRTAPNRVIGLPGVLTLGTGVRSDFADVTLADQTARTRRGVRLASRIGEQNGWAWAGQRVGLGDRVTVNAGVRADVFRFGVRDLAGNGSAHEAPVWASRISPKLIADADLGRGLTVRAAAGFGFHSNDARDVVLARDTVETLPRSVSTEVGIRYGATAVAVGLTLWRTDLGSELVFVGDEGVTEASGRTRRAGVELEARLRLTDWIWFDGDLSLTRGRLRDEAVDRNRIPLAPSVTGTAGVTVRDAGPVTAAVRVRHIGARPANEDATILARGATIAELSAAWSQGRTVWSVAVDNLLGAEWNEAQFATTSRLAHESAPVTELHFTPGSPRRITAGVRYLF